MSNLTSRHLLVGSDPHPIEVEPDDRMTFRDLLLAAVIVAIIAAVFAIGIPVLSVLVGAR